MIPATFRASFGYLLRHPWQLTLAVLGIAVGVAVMVAVDLANASARKAFLLSMDAVMGKATHQVIGGPRGVPESLYVDLRVEHAIRAIAPVVEGAVYIDGAAFSVMGVDLFAERQVRDFTLQAVAAEADGQTFDEALLRGFLVEPGTAAVSSDTASEISLEDGDSFELVAGSRVHSARLIAVFEGGESGGLDRLLVADIATAQEWLGTAGWLSRIDVRAGDDGVDLETLKAALPAGARVLSAAGRTRATADMSDAFMTNLTAMSLLALLVGLFLIFNSVSFSVMQRRGLIGVLRALGLSRRQLLAMLLAEAGLIGLCAAAIGVVFGMALGEALLELVARTINDLYYRVSVTDVRVEPWSIAKGFAAGVLAALLAAAGPAWEATSYPPQLALTRSALEHRARRAVPVVAMVGLGLIAAAIIVIILSGADLVAGLTAVFLLIMGLALLIPLFVRIGTNVLVPLADRIGGVWARMAVAGISAGLSRTAIAIVALTVAVSATVGVSVMVNSFRDSVSEWLEGTLRADLYAVGRGGPMEPGLVEAVRALEGVEAVSTSRQVWLEDEQGRRLLRVIDMAPGSYAGVEILDGDPAQMWPRWETQDIVLVSEPYAFQHGVAAGDAITLPTEAGPRDFTIAARFQSFDVNASVMLMSRATYARHYDDDSVDSVGIYLAGGTNAEAMADAVRNLAPGGGELRVRSNADLRQRSLQIFDRTFVITDVLYWLALGVAFIGILSAMLALQLERTREFATLRALGMTSRQVGSMIMTQTGVIGLLSGLASIPLGIVMAVMLIKVINRRAFGWRIDVAIAPEILAIAVLFAIGAAVLAGLYPAYRAGRSRPAIAMREE